VPVLSNGLSFLGVSFDAGERVARVRITAGNTPLGPPEGGGIDVVVMDDFIYSEPQPVRFQLTAATYTVNKSGGNALITVTRTGGTFGTASVNVATADGTARSGFDYTSFSGTLTFVNGQASRTISIPIQDDRIAKGLQTFTVALSAPSADTV